MAAEALAADAVASRLARQEEDIRWLWTEVHRLRDEQLNAPDRCQAEGPCLTREVAQLRAENRELRHRLYRLRLCLAEELSHQARRESALRQEAGREAAGAQVPGWCFSVGRGGARALRALGRQVGVRAAAGALRGRGGACPPGPLPRVLTPAGNPRQTGHAGAAASPAIARLT